MVRRAHYMMRRAHDSIFWWAGRSLPNSMNVATDMTKTRLRRHEVGERSHHGAWGSGVDVEDGRVLWPRFSPRTHFQFSILFYNCNWPWLALN